MRQNFAEALLNEGLAEVFAFSAERSPYGKALFAAEAAAKAAKKGVRGVSCAAVWTNSCTV